MPDTIESLREKLDISERAKRVLSKNVNVITKENFRLTKELREKSEEIKSLQEEINQLETNNNSQNDKPMATKKSVEAPKKDPAIEILKKENEKLLKEIAQKEEQIKSLTSSLVKTNSSKTCAVQTNIQEQSNKGIQSNTEMTESKNTQSDSDATIKKLTEDHQKEIERVRDSLNKEMNVLKDLYALLQQNIKTDIHNLIESIREANATKSGFPGCKSSKLKKAEIADKLNAMLKKLNIL